MTRDCSNFLDLKALLEKPARGLVAQVVEGYIREPGPLSRAIESLGNRVRSEAKYLPIQSGRKSIKDGERPAVERDSPGTVGLCTWNMQLITADVVTAHVGDFTSAQSGQDGKADDVCQEQAARILAEKLDFLLTDAPLALLARSYCFGKREDLPRGGNWVSLKVDGP
jgi:hypothetical protein